MFGAAYPEADFFVSLATYSSIPHQGSLPFPLDSFDKSCQDPFDVIVHPDNQGSHVTAP